MKRDFKKLPVYKRRLWNNKLLICLNYGFIGINFIVTSLFENNLNDPTVRMSIVLGIVMLCMVPTAYFDHRKEMNGKFSVISTCIMHFALSLFISISLSSWLSMILYAVEVLIVVFIKCCNVSKKEKNRKFLK